MKDSTNTNTLVDGMWLCNKHERLMRPNTDGSRRSIGAIVNEALVTCYS
jgi:hypothetical protein